MARDLRINVVDAAARFCEAEDDVARRALYRAVFEYDLAVRERRRRQRRENYKRARKQLIADMGGQCSLCKSKKKLEIDHPQGKDWNPTKTSRWARLARYRREWLAGMTRLLCRSCNASSKNHPKVHVPSATDDVPF